MLESFQAMLLQIEEQRRQEVAEKVKWLDEKQEREVAEEWQKALMEELLKEKRKRENETPERRQKEEISHQADNVKVFVQ